MNSIEERISQNVKSTLDAVVVLAGATNNLKVERRRRGGNSVESGMCLIHEGQIRPHEQQSLGRDRYVKPYSITLPDTSSDETPTPEGEPRSNRKSDVIKALCSTYTRGGLALDTRFTGSDSIDGPELSGDTLSFDVHFWTLKDDPFSQ